MNRSMVVLCGLVFAILAPPSFSAEGVVRDARVVRTLQADGGRWGECMALLDRAINQSGIDCPGQWVSFSCSGDFNTKDSAYKMFDTAQMAMALDLPVLVIADDQRKHSGWCYANRIDIMR